MAGNVVPRALAVRPEIPATVIWAGAVYTYSDMQKYGISDNSYRPPADQTRTRKKRNDLIIKYGQFDPKSSFWKMVPMTNYLSDINGAISLNHAVDDVVVDIEYSRELSKLLDETKIPHELNEYSSGGHNFTGSSFNEAMENTIKFFNKYLKQQ
jgi:dipeptidyl aminopeptidase/acylaminoacyl peptidase